jgi:glucosamine--fructose-6-phosphate aminotransferase (isomerizing)
MCGIIGYRGPGPAKEILVEGLRKLEYRGYDSAGLALLERGGIAVYKRAGKVAELVQALPGDLKGGVGVAHTRWATHGGVSDVNAHPHLSCDGSVAVVHNGIIENYEQIKASLAKRGHRFVSETDTEIIAHLLEGARGPRDILRRVSRLEGSFAFCALLSDGRLVGYRRGAPLILGVGQRELFIASDVLAFLKHTDKVVFMDNGELAVLEEGGYALFSPDGRRISRHPDQVAWEVAAGEEEALQHRTLSEILEQPSAIKRTLQVDVAKLAELIGEYGHVFFVAAGSSYHASLVGKYLLAKEARIRAEAILASEFTAYEELVDDALLVAISQSGETADVLEAVARAKQRGARVFGIVNVPSSTLARESDHVLYIEAGPERGVAATKSFTCQVALLLKLTERLAGRDYGLSSLPGLLNATLGACEEGAKSLAKLLSRSQDVFYLGRGINFPLALEGALKLKELAYIHAEGLAGGELKHGPLALIAEGVPVIALAPSDESRRDMMNNIREVRARGGYVIGISDARDDAFGYHLKLPKAGPMLYCVLEAVPLQLIAYYTTLERSLNPDYPRNLAKSVTVK